jgi:hypothetical protein
MAGTRGGLGRIAAMALALTVGLVLLFAGAARGARYQVVQCQAGAGADADWWDSTGAGKFGADAFCASDGEGDHLQSRTDIGGTVSGTRFARWRWLAPAGTYLTRVSGAWWHVLHDGFEQRIGAVNWAGGFEPLIAADAPDTPQRFFELAFPVPVAGLEDRLLCARGEDKWCSLAEQSWTADRLLSFELEDEKPPAAAIGGDLTAPGWRRGSATVGIWGNDAGSGVRLGDTYVDGARVARTEYPCDAVVAGGVLSGRRMQPCLTLVSEGQTVDTTGLADGPHDLVHCVSDFAGSTTCTAPQTVLTDNTPPAAPVGLGVVGGGGWRRANRFDVSWQNPDQGRASPIAGASWRLTGPHGFDTGIGFGAGQWRTTLAGLQAPDGGEYTLRIWLRDEAGNEAAANAATVALRFDDAPPGVAFAGGAADDDVDGDAPDRVTVDVGDQLSGPAAGTISFRRAQAGAWTDLPSHLESYTDHHGALSAPTPDLPPGGTLFFRAEASDGAGNAAATTLRDDGTPMVLRRAVAGAKGDKGDKTGRGGESGRGGKDGARGGRGADGDRGDKGPRGGRGDSGGRGPRGGRGAAGAGATRLLLRLRPARGDSAARDRRPVRPAPAGDRQAGGAPASHGTRRGPSSLTVPHGAAAVLAGRLVASTGKGAAGCRLRVAIRPARGSRLPARTVSVLTDRRGSFVLRLPPGPSRRLAVAFAGGEGLGPVRRHGLELRVRAGVTLTAAETRLANGEVLRLSGRVAADGATIPRPGKLVTISYLEQASRRWRPVLVTRSDPAGRFEAAYRFRYVSGIARVKLRATAPAEARWPYAPGSSPALVVEVDG